MARPGGDCLRSARITGRDEVRQHLAELGFVVNSDVTGGSASCRQSDPAGEGQPGGIGQDHGEPNHDLRADRRKNMKREFFYPSADGETDIHGVEWIPEGEVKAVLQISTAWWNT